MATFEEMVESFKKLMRETNTRPDREHNLTKKQLENKLNKRKNINAHISFQNGYILSIQKWYGTYGYEDGKYEIAVLDKDGVRYDTPITSDVIGYLEPEEVMKYYERVKSLKWKPREQEEL